MFHSKRLNHVKLPEGIANIPWISHSYSIILPLYHQFCWLRTLSRIYHLSLFTFHEYTTNISHYLQLRTLSRIYHLSLLTFHEYTTNISHYLPETKFHINYIPIISPCAVGVIRMNHIVISHSYSANIPGLIPIKICPWIIEITKLFLVKTQHLYYPSTCHCISIHHPFIFHNSLIVPLVIYHSVFI